MNRTLSQNFITLQLEHTSNSRTGVKSCFIHYSLRLEVAISFRRRGRNFRPGDFLDLDTDADIADALRVGGYFVYICIRICARRPSGGVKVPK